jgi:hypothetical protein
MDFLEIQPIPKTKTTLPATTPVATRQQAADRAPAFRKVLRASLSRRS